MQQELEGLQGRDHQALLASMKDRHLLQVNQLTHQLHNMQLLNQDHLHII